MIPSLKHPGARPETLLCIHASATNGRAWQAFAAPLRERFDVLTPDRLGHAGDTRWALGTPASLDAEARYLEPLLDASASGVHLIGHSFGGAVALQLALRRPDRVESLTLYEPTRFALLLNAPETETAGAEILDVGRTVSDWVLSGHSRAAAERFVDYWSGTGSWASMDERRRQSVVSHMPKVRAEFEAAFTDTTPLAAFGSLTMPVRLVAGTVSPMPAHVICERLASVLPAGDLVTLAGVGHMGPLTHPQRVLEVLPDALQWQRQSLAA